jgi:ABC-type transport system involved in cytochrome bd biosynthesis fused ATPase/permease subunit
MMMNKRLIGLAKGAYKYIAGNILFQWLSLLATAGVVFAVVRFLRDFSDGAAGPYVAALAVCAAARFLCTRFAARMGHLASESIKIKLRGMIYRKALSLGASYRGSVRTSEIVQAAGEGVDQIEVYFGKYLPQFFYGFIAPLTLFFLLFQICFPAALVLLVCAPLILFVVMAVSRVARKVFSKYWGVYTDLGASFLENLQGLTTLKIYGADEAAAKRMDTDAESFRRATMKVLGVQLSSLTAMDLMAFGGAAAGVITAVLRYAAGGTDLAGCLAVALLAAEFFIPMRLLGSYFHAAMNGVTASEKIFAILDLPEMEDGQVEFDGSGRIGVRASGLGFSYGGDGAPALRGVDLAMRAGGLTAIVGESGCGKSTLAGLLSGALRGYSGSARLETRPGSGAAAGAIRAVELRELSRASLMRHVTLVGANSHIFTGSVRDNLLMAKPDATDAEMWAALRRARLDSFIAGAGGLEARVSEGASNLSGGQKQRLAIARALMKDAAVYIFDEATSNIDAKSESLIMETIRELAGEKTVLVISHRLANVTEAGIIYVMERGGIAESGAHSALLVRGGIYAKMYGAQMDFENAAFAESDGATEVVNG